MGIPLLRQALSPAPCRLAAWQGAVDDVLASEAWARTLAAIARKPSRERGAAAGAAVDTLLLSPSLRNTMGNLHHESAQALARHGLDDLIQIQGFVVDRLEDDDDAVILLGPAQRSYLLSRFLLRVAGLDREKVWGILVATRTGTGIDLDVWPAVGEDTSGAWTPDAELLSLTMDGIESLDLAGQALAPARERQPAQSCFGTQVYDIRPDGTVTCEHAHRPRFLDACLPRPATCPAP